MTAVGRLTSVARQKGPSTSRFLRSQGEGKRRSLVGGPFFILLLRDSARRLRARRPVGRSTAKGLRITSNPLKSLRHYVKFFVDEPKKAGVAVETAVVDGVSDDNQG